ncbi:hypothetical protein K503DRAFT_416260 [Rhizopogon vinicolor AM-OR11-026]|uniref:Uncharacterized protein n=1 Tax=Rhizopogon vinicolor AM-OR11-026 TaxID=1314800 RepID=A0A1B7NBA2_9AGAM|nr:hypothetical protein K503DRAFT_416260 [Rhizopogon vinicolor AM-OR11-026]
MLDHPNWSKLSDAISSRASDALNEAKQLKDSIPQQGVELPDIKWSKLSGAIVSRASNALNEVKQFKDSIPQQHHVDLPHVDWSKLSGGILSRASDAWKEVKQLFHAPARCGTARRQLVQIVRHYRFQCFQCSERGWAT